MQRVFLILGLICLISAGVPGENGDLTPYEFNIPRGFPTMPVSAENPTTVEGAALGRFLFYDPILSRDSTISCASCHKQEYAFSDGGKKFSIGIDGEETVRNTPPLFNLAWYPAMFWDGKAPSIEEQVFVPVRDHSEMDLDWTEAEIRISNSSFYRGKFEELFGKGRIDSVKIARVIAQFERTLISSNSKFDLASRGEAKLTNQEIKGFQIVNDQSMGDCIHCHTTDAHLMGSTFIFSNNGLENVSNLNDYPDKGLGAVTGDSTKNGWFKVPSIRNITLTGPYMHDGRFNTLNEVLDFYSEGLNHPPNIDSKMTRVRAGGVQLSDEDKQAVLDFFMTLTDSVFITNPEFSNPWKI